MNKKLRDLLRQSALSQGFAGYPPCTPRSSWCPQNMACPKFLPLSKLYSVFNLSELMRKYKLLLGHCFTLCTSLARFGELSPRKNRDAVSRGKPTATELHYPTWTFLSINMLAAMMLMMIAIIIIVTWKRNFDCSWSHRNFGYL